jgi:hypothetical protein
MPFEEGFKIIINSNQSKKRKLRLMEGKVNTTQLQTG